MLLAGVCASAQPVCPPINFLNAKTINLDATDSSHLVVLRQGDGSYTAFEVADTSPYGVLRTISHFERQFSICQPPKISPASRNASVRAPTAAGVGGQPAGFAVLDSGNYLFVSPSGDSLNAAIFDPHLHLVSEKGVGALPSEVPGAQNVYLSLVLADVNGDGKLDVIAEYEYQLMGLGGFTGGIQILLGDGLGGFQRAGSFSLDGFTNGSMAVGDLNGDGKPDIVVGLPPAALLDQTTGLPAGSLVLAMGKGDGTFATSILPTPNEIGPASIAIADLNGDGKNDLVFLTCPLTTDVPFVPNQVAVMLGKGDGTFLPQAVFPVNVEAPTTVLNDAGTVSAIAVGDVNGDGIPDIVTNGITILLGDGKGGFPTRKDFLNTTGESVVLTDFDGDGKVDVLIGIGNPLVLSRQFPLGKGFPFTQDALTVFLGDGTGGLAAAPLAPSPNAATGRAAPFNRPGQVADAALTAGDFNQDGVTDLAFVSEYQYLSVFLASASGAITPSFTYDFAAVDQLAFPTSVVAGDFNQDGIPDLAVTVARPTSDGSILIFLGKGDGAFLAPVSIDAPGSIWSLVTGDFNKDGHADLAAIETTPNFEADRVVVFPGQGDGTFATPRMYAAGTGAIALAVGDFNRDAFDDIAVANGTGVSLLLGKADGTLSPGANITSPEGTSLVSLAAADLNGDGKLDLMAGFQAQGVAILFGNGDGTFLPPGIYSTLPPGIYSTNPQSDSAPWVVAGDINGDGIPDVFLSNRNVLIGNGDGTFRLQTLDLPDLLGPLIAADFNGDGKLDVASGFSFGRHGATILFNLSTSSALLSVVSAADFSYGPMSPHSIASAFGKHLALSRASATPPSLPTSLGGASVSVQDQTGAVSQAEIYYASPEQVNFILPQSLEPGTAIVTIKTTDGQSASSEIQIAQLAPKIFMVDPSGIPAGYVVRVGVDNVQTMEPIFAVQGGHVQEVPIDLGTGDVYLILFGTGFDASPFGVVLQTGAADLTASYAGPQSQFPGLDQIDILLPKSLAGSGRLSVRWFFIVSAVEFYITIK